MKVNSLFQPLTIGFHSHPTSIGTGTMVDLDEDTEDMSHSDLLIMAHSQQQFGGIGVSSNAGGDINHSGMNNDSMRKAEIRKSNKPIMEKRRRARINNCLNDLKAILLEAMRKDPARHSKLEKADILELTVRHLQNVQRNQLALAMATDPTVLHRFRNGFAECLTEVSRYLTKMDGVDQGVRQRLTGHLSTCVNGLQQVNNPFGNVTQPLKPPSAPTQQPPIQFNSSLIGSNTQIPFIQQQPTTTVPIKPNSDNLTFDLPIHHRQHDLSTVLSQDQDLNNNNNSSNRHQQQPAQPRFSSAFSALVSANTTILASPPLRSSSSSAQTVLISPPNSSLEGCSSTGTGSLEVSSSNLNSSTGSDVSISTGSEKGTNTSPNSFALAAAAASTISSSPIDFSLKEKSPAVRVLKVEPMMMAAMEEDHSEVQDMSRNRGRPTILPTKDCMWRPW